VSSRVYRLLPVYLVVFVGFLGYSLMIAVFTPMMLRNDNGMLPASSSTAQRSVVLGVLLALYPLGQFIGSPILGALSDHYGRRRILLGSLAATTALYAAIASALAIQSLALLLVASFLAGLSEANVVIAQGAIADAASRQDRERLFGYVYLSSSLAYVVGPLGGGKLADRSLASWFSYQTPYWAVAILLLLVLIAIMRWFKETHRQTGEQSNYLEAFTNLRRVVTDRRLRGLYWINFLLYLAIFGFFRVYPMYLVDRFHLSVGRVSEFIAWVAVPIVFANVWLVGALSKRLLPRTLVTVSALATGVLMTVIVLPSSQASLWFTLGSTALALAVCLPATAAMLSLAADDNVQGRVMGNNQSMQVGAESVSGLVGGSLAAAAIRLPLLVFAGAAILGGVAVTRVRPGSGRACATEGAPSPVPPP
jgi:DHA1 family tetracycline resistance protein-like MFS transporter